MNYCDLKSAFSFSLLIMDDAFSPFLIDLVSTKVFKAEKSAACFAISVAKMHPMTLFRTTLNSSFDNPSKKLY